MSGFESGDSGKGGGDRLGRGDPDHRSHPEGAELGATLRKLPAIERLAASLEGVPHRLALAAARRQVGELRARINAGERVDLDPQRVREATRIQAAGLAGPSLRPVINATGVVLHTNLGRAPLAPRAAEAAAGIARGYSNLEYELGRGERGSRHSHLQPLLLELTGAEAAIAVNNNAAAVLLALAATAAGREVLVGRGQLVEIGGSFRVPEILAQSGARLLEVGTTNRTRLADYERAIGPDAAAILRVHPSNFRAVGFTEEAAIAELAALATERGIRLIDDLGSGAPEPLWDEPPVRASIEAGATLLCISADKLLGGPQAGILCGEAEAVERCRAHPLARALRLDKLQLAALEATVRLYLAEGAEAIPALAALKAPEAELRTRAERLAGLVGDRARVERSASRPGGGSLPLLELEGPVCAVDPGELGAEALAERLRSSEPPVVARISKGRVLLDPRTITDQQAELAGRAVRDALR